MWYIMENVQQAHRLSDRLIRAICNWHILDGYNDDVEDLINQGADVNRIHGGLLPLQCAAMVSDSYTLRLLLQKGAQINMADVYGRAAIHYAAERDVECCKILLEHGADPNCPDAILGTPLHWATFKNNLETAKLLLQVGANPDATDFNDDTPLSWAAHKGHLNAIRLLLDYNATVDKRNQSGHTPLQRAAVMVASGLNTDQEDACLELLVRSSGQFDIRDGEGQVIGIIAEDNKLTDVLLPLCKSPRSLSSLCRFQIRSNLGKKFLPNVIPKLPVPKSLAAYISLQI